MPFCSGCSGCSGKNLKSFRFRALARPTRSLLVWRLILGCAATHSDGLPRLSSFAFGAMLCIALFALATFISSSISISLYRPRTHSTQCTGAYAWAGLETFGLVHEHQSATIFYVSCTFPGRPKKTCAKDPVQETTCDFYPNNPNNPRKIGIIRQKRPNLADNLLRSATFKTRTSGSSYCSRMRPKNAALVVIWVCLIFVRVRVVREEHRE